MVFWIITHMSCSVVFHHSRFYLFWISTLFFREKPLPLCFLFSRPFLFCYLLFSFLVKWFTIYQHFLCFQRHFTLIFHFCRSKAVSYLDIRRFELTLITFVTIAKFRIVRNYLILVSKMQPVTLKLQARCHKTEVLTHFSNNFVCLFTLKL